MGKQSSKSTFLTSSFKARLDTFLAEPGHRLVKVIGYEEETGYEYNDNDADVRSQLNSASEGHYVVVREQPNGDIQWMSETRIGSDGDRVSKKEQKRAQAMAPEAHTNSAMIRHVGETYAGLIAIQRQEIIFLNGELNKARAERDNFWEQIREGSASDDNEQLMKLGLTVFQAWQSRDFKEKGQDFCKRVLGRMADQPQVFRDYLAGVMTEELRNESNGMLLEAAKTLADDGEGETS